MIRGLLFRWVVFAWAPVVPLFPAASAADSITADQGVAAGRDIRDSTINIGIPLEQLPAIIEASTKPLRELNDTQRVQIERLEQQLGVGQRALLAFFQAIGEAGVPAEQQAARLAEIARRYNDLLQQVASRPGDDAAVATLKDQAREALEAGQLDRADALLADALAAQDAAVDRQQLAAAATSARRGEIALTRLRYRDAAGHFAAAASRVPAGSPDQRLVYLDREADALYWQGLEFGDNDAARLVIARYRALVVEPTRERVPLAWATTRHNLGKTLLVLFERRPGDSLLDEAETAIAEARRVHVEEAGQAHYAACYDGLLPRIAELRTQQATDR